MGISNYDIIGASISDIYPQGDYMGSSVTAQNKDTYLFYITLCGILKEQGLREPANKFAALVALFESAYGKSNVAKKNNNFSGIKYNPDSKWQSGKGLISPEGNYYANYDNINNWSADFVKELRKGGIESPANATTLQQFVHRLKAIGYFTAEEQRYYNLVKSVGDKVNFVEEYAHPQSLQDQAKQDAKKLLGKGNWWSKLPLIAKVGIIAGSALVLNNLTKNGND